MERMVEIGGRIVSTDKPLPQRREHDFYPTPQRLADQAVALLRDDHHTVLDPGAGTGVWGKAARTRYPDAFITGVELRQDAVKPDGYNAWHTGTFLTWCDWHLYSAIIGNPPYKHAEAFIRRAWTLLHAHGEMLLLLRLAFLEGKARGTGLWQEMPPARVYVCVNRISFTGNGRTDATAYALYHWRKGVQEPTTLDWFDWKRTAK